MQKKKLGRIVLILAAAALMLTLSGPATAKSLYFAADHHTAAFDAWNINADGTVNKQATYTLQHATDPAGVAIHNGKNLLFLTSEFSNGVEIVDPITLTYYGVSSGPSDLAGIDVDDMKDLVYTVGRMTGVLYIFKWDDTTKQLDLQNTVSLPNCSQALGIALDETRNILWVADTPNQRVRAYDLNSDPISEDTDRSFTPSFKPVDIAVDRKRNLVYSVSMYGGASLPSGTGSLLLSKWDVANNTESTVDMGAYGVGVAVDEVSGYVYVTHGAYIGDNLIA
jgi:DNA-binding beta-propeller fold protein YncE